MRVCCVCVCVCARAHTHTHACCVNCLKLTCTARGLQELLLLASNVHSSESKRRVGYLVSFFRRSRSLLYCFDRQENFWPSPSSYSAQSGKNGLMPLLYIHASSYLRSLGSPHSQTHTNTVVALPLLANTLEVAIGLDE